MLDTNCLISSLSRRGQFYPVWKGLQAGEFAIGEQICRVSDDKHYDVLREIDFPQILVLKLKEFLGLLSLRITNNC